MEEKVDQFLDGKRIEHPLAKEVVKQFIIKHTELFGEIVSLDSLLTRLNSNLTEVILQDPDQAAHSNASVVGEYVGFDANRITMYFNDNHLKNAQLKEDFTSLLIHELTHCAYTIKTGYFHDVEQHIFSTAMSPDGHSNFVSAGHTVFMEPIVNYISTQIVGKRNSAYVPQTVHMEKLATIVGASPIIKAAWDSSEEEFKTCFSQMPVGAYDYFTNGMSFFNSGDYKRGDNVMQRFYNGEIYTRDTFASPKEELQFLKVELEGIKAAQSSPLVTHNPTAFEKGKAFIKTFIKSKGYVDNFLLDAVVMITLSILLLLALF